MHKNQLLVNSHCIFFEIINLVIKFHIQHEVDNVQQSKTKNMQYHLPLVEFKIMLLDEPVDYNQSYYHSQVADQLHNCKQANLQV